MPPKGFKALKKQISILEQTLSDQEKLINKL